MAANLLPGPGPTRLVIRHDSITDERFAADARVDRAQGRLVGTHADGRIREQHEVLIVQERSEHAQWMGRIQEALELDRFVLFAQPIVDLATRQTVHHELLIRSSSTSRPRPSPTPHYRC
jgi:predicted signal transduction protein with EAL and GGDEF domain